MQTYCIFCATYNPYYEHVVENKEIERDLIALCIVRGYKCKSWIELKNRLLMDFTYCTINCDYCIETINLYKGG